MATMINEDITNQGIALIEKALTGAEIRYTGIQLGDGYLPNGQSPRNTEALVSPVTTIPISKVRLNGDGTIVVGGVFTNENMTQGFYYRELGLMAEDPDLGEILYCYGNAGDLAEWIDAHETNTIIEKVIDIITVVGSTTNVSAYLTSEIYATKDELSIVEGTANDALAKAQEALDKVNGFDAQLQAILDQLAAQYIQINDNTARINIIWDALFNDITGNPFTISFATLDGIILNSGVWNATLQRLEV